MTSLPHDVWAIIARYATRDARGGGNDDRAYVTSVRAAASLARTCVGARRALIGINWRGVSRNRLFALIDARAPTPLEDVMISERHVDHGWRITSGATLWIHYYCYGIMVIRVRLDGDDAHRLGVSLWTRLGEQCALRPWLSAEDARRLAHADVCTAASIHSDSVRGAWTSSVADKQCNIAHGDGTAVNHFLDFRCVDNTHPDKVHAFCEQQAQLTRYVVASILETVLGSKWRGVVYLVDAQTS